MKYLRLLAVYLGLVEEDEDEWHRRECRRGHHEWNIWSHDTSPVPLYILLEPGGDDAELFTPDGRAWRKVGYEHVAIKGPDYRRCQWCPAMERRVNP